MVGRKVTGTVLVAATVASLTAGVVLGPLGNQVFARNGDAARGPDTGFVSSETPVFNATPKSAPAFRETKAVRRGASAARYARIKSSTHAHRVTTALNDRRPSSFGHHSICVRLCDGFYFPIGDVHDAGDIDTQAAICSSACPGAPTRLFTTPSGTSEIETAASTTDGKPYTALPVAFAHTSAIGPTCACHTANEDEPALMTPARDITMRDGDSVMTAAGWRVFKGNRRWPYTGDNFTSVAAASGFSKDQRIALAAMERATLGPVGGATAEPSTLLDISVGHADVDLKDADGKVIRLVGSDTGYYR